MASTPETVLKDLKNGKFAPVYFIQGEEPYFVDKITHYIEQHAIPPHDRGFNQVVMYGKDVTMSTVINNAKRFPMMADRQAVIVKEAQQIEGLGREDVDNLLISYVKNPLPSTILVFAHKHKTLDGRKALAKELDKHAILVKSSRISEYKIIPYIEAYIKEHKFTIEPKALQVLAESIGGNLEVLTNEIDKMLINFSEPVMITVDHIQKYIGISKEFNIFELTNALSFRNVAKANAIIYYFSQNPKANPLIPMITVLFTHFNRILLVYGNKNLPDSQLAGVLKVNPYFIKEYLTAAKNYSLGKVIDIFTYLKEADLQSKGVESNNLPHSQILKELIFKILH
ncbi:DNA polymerase III subunit delta [Lunatimonas salinarum]|uniref:DNA polymerase III subunit delta n=1 Tax=Lunatimonas salinarum TaxID=1774590 RepID=UPI001AE0B860|nr:DNA polymerase III subunit delta [Lunatimonas salinarum]